MLLKITALALTAALGAVPAYAETPEIRGSIIVAANIMTPKKAEIELASGRFASSRDYLAALERIALASEAEERQFRRDAQRRIAELAAATMGDQQFRRDAQRRIVELAAARTAAYRRYNLFKAMVETAAAHPYGDPCVAAQIARIAALTGWSESDARWPEFKQGLAEVARVIHGDLHGPAGEGSPKAQAAASVTEAFRQFEAWYRGHFGAEFVALLERQSMFQPAVDF